MNVHIYECKYTTDLSARQRFLLALSVSKCIRTKEISCVAKEMPKLDTQNVISKMNGFCYIFTY